MSYYSNFVINKNRKKKWKPNVILKIVYYEKPILPFYEANVGLVIRSTLFGYLTEVSSAIRWFTKSDNQEQVEMKELG